MANLWFKNILGQIPSTEKIENKYDQLISDYEHFNRISESNELIRYKELEVYLASSEFIEEKKKISEAIFSKSEEESQLKELKKISSSSEVKKHLKNLKSTDYQNDEQLEKSATIARYEELKELTESSEFQLRVEYLKDNKKFEKSELGKLAEEFEQLKNSDDLKWYFKTIENSPFESLKTWNLVFEENFNGNTLDRAKWNSIIFQGLISIDDNYATEGELQLYTKENNLKIQNSELNIITKKEFLKGKSWSVNEGFTQKEFQYSSGTINTGHSFQFNKGKIEAKMNVENGSNVIHSLCLKGEKSVPHIDIFKTGNRNGFEFRFIPKEGLNAIKSDKVKGINVNGKYYIYGLEWTENEFIWTFNNIEVGRIQHNLTNEQLYLNICTIVEKAPEELPINFKIDWIRVFSKK